MIVRPNVHTYLNKSRKNSQQHFNKYAYLQEYTNKYYCMVEKSHTPSVSLYLVMVYKKQSIGNSSRVVICEGTVKLIGYMISLVSCNNSSCHFTLDSPVVVLYSHCFLFKQIPIVVIGNPHHFLVSKYTTYQETPRKLP